ncbi:M14 family zinc carboxypeptidase, partial [Olleya namhaensis]
MNKITFTFLLLFTIVQTSFSQDKHSRIKISNPTERIVHTIAAQGIDLSCGSKNEDDNLIIELSETELQSLKKNNISYTVEIDDLTKFYANRAIKDLPQAKAELRRQKAQAKSRTTNTQNRSVSSLIHDNIIQYTDCDEINWVTPQNFELGSMGGCLTYSEMQSELDQMYAYSQSNGLNIVSQKANASSTNQKTYGNVNGPGTDFQPSTVWYIRITGDQSTTPENTKPQMLYTSMIHSREVSALMNNIYFMWYIIENYSTDPAIKELVDNNELYFVPVVNPDGLRWNEYLNPNGGGMQRKNLRPNTGGNTNTSTNRGVDLNRNFDYFWGYNNIGSSGTTTSGTYRGTRPESEPETQIMVDFIDKHQIKSAVWNHSYANSVPHPYGGVPSLSSGREDEYYKWHEEMTRYNRYLYGATIFYESNGLPDDWMMGGNPDNNGATGSGQGIIATTPEHGGQGFWPTPSTIVPIAQSSMRISLATAYYGGKYAKLHDLTQSNITNAIGSTLDFGIERIGQTASNFTVTVTPISSNITSTPSPVTESGIPVLGQRTVSISLDLNPAITVNETIAYNVKLSNDDGVIYEANYEKHYQPTLLFDHQPDTNGLTGWTQTGGWNNTTTDAYSGNNALSTGTYSNSATKTLTTTNSYDFTDSNEIIIQFYSKWDIERNYDFVEILGSPDGGSSWIPLCGNYTKPNATSSTTSHDNKSSSYANFQANSSGQIYDGDQLDNWIMEEISIDNANYSSLKNSNNVKIRFNFRTDGQNVNENYSTTNDGFFIDDFKIISVNTPCMTTVPTNVAVSDITTVSARIDWDAVASANYDIRYRETGSGSTGWTTVTNLTTNSYQIAGLSHTTQYDVRVRTRCSTSTSSYTTIEKFTTSSPVPCTGSSITSFPYSESFENTLGLWTQDTTDDFNWTNKQEETDGNSTPSSETGPSTASDGSYFLYTEASNPNFPSKIARLISPCLDFTDRENASIAFDYHMYGTNIGILTVDISTDNGANYITLDTYTLAGSKQVSHTDAWKTQNVDLSTFDNQTIKLRFSATTDSDASSGWSGDISIDKLSITSDQVSNSTPPTALCQNINIQLDSTGNASIVAGDIDGGSTDDVAITNYSIDINSFDCNDIGTPVSVTLTVTDADNQTDTCTALVTVLDQIKPDLINVPSNMSLSCGNNNPTWTSPTATDNCDDSLTVIRTDSTGLNSGDTFPVGNTTISYQVTDTSGNTKTASFSINIIADTINPNAVTQNITIQLDNSGNATITPSAINNGSSDNCSIANFTLSKDTFDCSDIGNNVITLTVTDINSNTDTANATVTVTRQDMPTATNCWDNFTYSNTTCTWENKGTKPAEPTTECYETATFNNTTCTWDVIGTQPAEPTTECYETATFNNTTCTWDVSGTQPTEPTTECYETATFNNTTCTWNVSGTKPAEPTTECYETTTFNNTTCTWDISGTQPAEPTTECYETATFNNTTCTWDVSGTQPAEPTTECYETATFNNTTCTWNVSGSKPAEPTTECYETATFNSTTCTWDVSGSKPAEPTTECYETATFNNTTCTWDVTGTKPAEPTTECYETATFNNTTCTWDISGSKPAEPTTECYETATFNNTTCTWDVTGTKPAEP